MENKTVTGLIAISAINEFDCDCIDCWGLILQILYQNQDKEE